MLYLWNSLWGKNISQEYFKTFAVFLAVLCTYIYIRGKKSLLEQHREQKRRDYHISKFPGLKRYGYLGSMPELLHLLWNPCKDFLPWLETMMQEKGPYFVMWVSYQAKLFISDVDISIHLLRNNLLKNKSSDAKVGRLVGGEGLLTFDGEEHAVRRKMWNPGFTRKIIDDSLRIFNQQARKLCQSIDKWQGTGKEVDMMWPCISTAFRTIAYSAFGEEYMNQLPDSVSKEHTHALHTLALKIAKRQLARPWLSNEWVYSYLTYDGHQVRKCIQQAHKLTKRAVDSRKQLRRKNNGNTNQKTPCFSDLLLDLEEAGKLTKWEVVQELNLFIAAGYDTSGLTLLYLLYFLALHPEHQERVVNELREIFGEEIILPEEINAVQVKQMKYLEMCLKETLRLYPVVALVFRSAASDVHLPDGRIIPKNTDVYIAQTAIHHNEKHFPEPEKFIPERHLTPNVAWMPFAVGNRACIGQTYAMQEIKIIAAHLLMMYHWETMEKPGLQPSIHILLVPENGIKFKITRRNNNLKNIKKGSAQ